MHSMHTAVSRRVVGGPVNAIVRRDVPATATRTAIIVYAHFRDSQGKGNAGRTIPRPANAAGWACADRIRTFGRVAITPPE